MVFHRFFANLAIDPILAVLGSQVVLPLLFSFGSFGGPGRSGGVVFFPILVFPSHRRPTVTQRVILVFGVALDLDTEFDL